MRFGLVLILPTAGILLVAAAAPADGVRQEKRAGAALARLHVDRPEIALSGEVIVTLSVEGPAPLGVEVLPATSGADDWQIDAANPETTPAGPNAERWQQTIHMMPYRTGKLPLPVPSLRLYRRTQTVTWDPVLVTVTTQITRVDPGEAADITPIEAVPPAFPWLFWTLVGGLGVLALAALAWLGWLLRRRRQRPMPPPTADQWALGELERVERLELPAAGQSERYHTLLADVIRRYLELRFDLHATEQTTAEFLTALRQSSQLAPAQQERLREFLERCDLAKFAPVQLAPEECRIAAELARALVAETAGPVAQKQPV